MGERARQVGAANGADAADSGTATNTANSTGTVNTVNTADSANSAGAAGESAAGSDDGADVAAFVAAAVAGDQAAWNEIVARYTPLLIAVVLRFRLSSAEREDVVQTVWLRLVEHLGQIREPRALPSWIITTTRREACRSLAGGGHVVPQDPQSPAWEAYPAVLEDVDADLVRAERHEALLVGLTELNPRQRELLLLLSQDPPLAYAEISRRTGIPVGAIGPTRARALERLRRTDQVRALALQPQAPAGGRTS